MNIHKNARTTVHSRALIVFRVVEEKQPPKQVATDFGVSVRTVYKWLARFREAQKPFLFYLPFCKYSEESIAIS